jgi:hypothetical protein
MQFPRDHDAEISSDSDSDIEFTPDMPLQVIIQNVRKKMQFDLSDSMLLSSMLS